MNPRKSHVKAVEVVEPDVPRPANLDDVMADLGLEWDKAPLHVPPSPSKLGDVVPVLATSPEQRFALGWLRSLFLAICLALAVRYCVASVHYAVEMWKGTCR